MNFAENEFSKNEVVEKLGAAPRGAMERDLPEHLSAFREQHARGHRWGMLSCQVTVRLFLGHVMPSSPVMDSL